MASNKRSTRNSNKQNNRTTKSSKINNSKSTVAISNTIKQRKRNQTTTVIVAPAMGIVRNGLCWNGLGSCHIDLKRFRHTIFLNNFRDSSANYHTILHGIFLNSSLQLLSTPKCLDNTPKPGKIICAFTPSPLYRPC